MEGEGPAADQNVCMGEDEVSRKYCENTRMSTAEGGGGTGREGRGGEESLEEEGEGLKECTGRWTGGRCGNSGGGVSITPSHPRRGTTKA